MKIYSSFFKIKENFINVSKSVFFFFLFLTICEEKFCYTLNFFFIVVKFTHLLIELTESVFDREKKKKKIDKFFNRKMLLYIKIIYIYFLT